MGWIQLKLSHHPSFHHQQTQELKIRSIKMQCVKICEISQISRTGYEFKPKWRYDSSIQA